jgi:hypothetical protein
MRSVMTIVLFVLYFFIALCFLSCAKERYRADRKNKMTKRATIANDYLANQAVDLTQGNIEKRKSTDKVARKKLEQQQKELNEANAKTSKVKKPKMHPGNFKFY